MKDKTKEFTFNKDCADCKIIGWCDECLLTPSSEQLQADLQLIKLHESLRTDLVIKRKTRIK